MTNKPTYDQLLEKVNHLEKEVAELRNKLATMNTKKPCTCTKHTIHQDQFKIIIDNAPIIVDSFDENGQCILWNKKGEEILGWSMEELVNTKEPLTLFYPDPIKREEAHHNITNADGRFREYRLTAKDGSQKIQEWANFQLEDKTSIAFGIDITEKRQTEKKIKQNHEFINTLLQTIPNPVFSKDTQGKYTGCNKAFEDFMGSSQESIIGKRAFDIFPMNLAKKYHAKEQLLLEKSTKDRYETSIINAKAETKEVIFDNASIMDSNDNISGIVGIISDITQRKKMERSLKQSDARLKAFTEAIPDILFIFDEDGQYVEIFTNTSELLFNKLSSLKNNYIQNCLPEAVAKQHMEIIRKTIENQENYFFEYTLKVPKGTCWFESHTAPIKGLDEKKQLIASSVRDITDRKLAEKEIYEKEKLTAVMETAGAVCHELNQPLHIISGCCELLHFADNLDEQTKHKLDTIVKETQRMAKLNHNLMHITSYKTKSYQKSKIIDITGAAGV